MLFFRTEIRVLLKKSYLIPCQFQAFAAVFPKMELVCANGKHYSGGNVPFLNFAYKICEANKFSPSDVMCSVTLKTFTSTSSPTI